MIKICTKCGEPRQASEFYKCASKRDGLASNCIECVKKHRVKNKDAIRAGIAAWKANNKERTKATDAAYRAANSEKERARVAAWAAANKGRRSATNAAWAAANKDRKNATNAAWVASNKDRVRATVAAWAIANKDRRRANGKAWREANPEAGRVKTANYRASKRANGGKLSNGLAAKLFKLQRGKCACCGVKLTVNHMDHRIPVALGGPNEDWNMQLLCAPCNLSKGAKHPVDFMQQRGFLL